MWVCKKCKDKGEVPKRSLHDGKIKMVLCSCRYVNPHMRATKKVWKVT